MIADVFSKAVSWGFSNFDSATSADWFLIILFYTFEIYFDFSSYSDMATGSSLMLNIMLPINFDSPYKALSVNDFWKRWHMSLTRFFTKYVYIPLGGNRKGVIRTYINTMIVFLISGYWHGANWTFILWGVLNGFFMILDKIFSEKEEKIFTPLRWILTFTCVSILWLLFRSESIDQWLAILNKTISFTDTSISPELKKIFVLPETEFIIDILHIRSIVKSINGFWMLIYIVLVYGIVLIPENNYRCIDKIDYIFAVITAILFVWSVICLSNESAFVYFGF